jgi:hypothetical protein
MAAERDTLAKAGAAALGIGALLLWKYRTQDSLLRDLVLASRANLAELPSLLAASRDAPFVAVRGRVACDAPLPCADEKGIATPAVFLESSVSQRVLETRANGLSELVTHRELSAAARPFRLELGRDASRGVAAAASAAASPTSRAAAPSPSPPPPPLPSSSSSPSLPSLASAAPAPSPAPSPSPAAESRPAAVAHVVIEDARHADASYLSRCLVMLRRVSESVSAVTGEGTTVVERVLPIGITLTAVGYAERLPDGALALRGADLSGVAAAATAAASALRKLAQLAGLVRLVETASARHPLIISRLPVERLLSEQRWMCRIYLAASALLLSAGALMLVAALRSSLAAAHERLAAAITAARMRSMSAAPAPPPPKPDHATARSGGEGASTSAPRGAGGASDGDGGSGGAAALVDDTCVVCMDQRREVVLVRCGHLICCAGCAARLRRCPVCRAGIERVVRVFGT